MDLTKDCKIEFIESVFSGKYPRVQFSHNRVIVGTILKESYGSGTGQHTFTILVESCDDESISIGSKILRKGRNVYSKCRVLSYPDNHRELADDKHERSKSVKDSIRQWKAFDKGNYAIFENN